jgi:hypothetical protein
MDYGIICDPFPNPSDSMADDFYDRVATNILDATSTLNDDEYIQIIYYDQRGNEDIVYNNPHLIILHCKMYDKSKAKVLLHMQSTQLILKILKKSSEYKYKAIGFLGETQNKK